VVYELIRSKQGTLQTGCRMIKCISNLSDVLKQPDKWSGCRNRDHVNSYEEKNWLAGNPDGALTAIAHQPEDCLEKQIAADICLFYQDSVIR